VSLKAFHIVFVIVAMVLCLGVGAWYLAGFGRTGDGESLALGAAGISGGVVLGAYGVWFLKKLKGWSYL
jgi:hypothetical protein